MPLSNCFIKTNNYEKGSFEKVLGDKFNLYGCKNYKKNSDTNSDDLEVQCYIQGNGFIQYNRKQSMVLWNEN